jgi:UDP-N-acetyl-2-amino-2-deoxyglucuronate dehydrogenase
LELHGSTGTIVLEGTEDVWLKEWATEAGGRRALTPPSTAHGDSDELHGGGAAAVLEEGAEALGREMADFVCAIREGRPPLIDGKEGRRSLAVVRAVYESARLGGVPVEP